MARAAGAAGDPEAVARLVFSTIKPDRRPPRLLQDVRTMVLDHVEATPEDAIPFAVVRDIAAGTLPVR